jgi:tetratricopeptide (TPR) repeat protein
MTYEPNLEDTRPQAPISDADLTPGVVYGGMDEGAAPARGGCGITLLLGGALLLLALLIVGLATAAGWTTGQREAAAFATATQSSVIADQINRIPQDIANGNTLLLQNRLQYLATLTPGVPEVLVYSSTATALFESLLPTATPTPSPTLPATSSAPLATATLPATNAEGGYDLPALLQQAQTAVDTAQWEDAIGLLDAINGIDPNFEAVRVRNLLSSAHNSYARELYNTYRPGDPGQLALAIVITDRAESLGVLGDGLSFERNAAQLYLDASRAIGLDPFAAIRAFERLLSLGQGRYYDEARQELYNQYVALGDAQTALNEHCPAVGYYQSALNYNASGIAISKRDTATTLCSQATPIPLPGTLLAPISGSPIAPIGVVGTPSG